MTINNKEGISEEINTSDFIDRDFSTQILKLHSKIYIKIVSKIIGIYSWIIFSNYFDCSIIIRNIYHKNNHIRIIFVRHLKKSCISILNKFTKKLIILCLFLPFKMDSKLKWR